MNYKKRSQTGLSSIQEDIEPIFQALVEQSLVGIYIIQDDLFRYLNPAFARVFGYSDPNDLINKVKVFDLVAPESHERVKENVQRRLSGGAAALHYTFVGLKKDGSRIHVEVHSSRARFDGRQALVGLLVDISERKHLEEAIRRHDQQLERLVEERTERLNQALERVEKSEQRYRVIFHQSKLPMLLLDPLDGAIVDANDASCSYYGYPYETLTGMGIYQINQLSEAEVAIEIKRAESKNRDHFFFVHKLADGSLRDVEVHSGPLEINGKRLLYSIIHDITDRRAAEARLKELNRDFITLLENTTDFIYFKDRQGRFRFCSQTLARITGHGSWRDMVGKHDLEVFPQDTAKINQEEAFPVCEQGGALLNHIDPYYDEHGKKGWISTNKWAVFDDNGKEVIGLFGISRDITAQHNAEEKLRVAASVFENANEGILIADAAGDVVEVNRAFCRITGYTREEILGKNPRFLKSGHHDESFFKKMWESLDQTGYWQGEVWNRRKDGSLFACRTSINVLTDKHGKVDRYIGLHSDITDFLRHHQQIEHMAYYDALTELPNRVLFSDRMSQALAVSDRTRTSLAVCFLDLDLFKPVNDRFGHKAGDLMLIEIARRLQRCVRTEDTVARLGGDEFALLLTHLNTEAGLLHLLDRIVKVIAEPFNVTADEKVSVSASVGVSLYPDNRLRGEQLLRLADKAMYEAKELGRNQYRIDGQIVS